MDVSRGKEKNGIRPTIEGDVAMKKHLFEVIRGCGGSIRPARRQVSAVVPAE
jgi:hypothetical protein